MDTLTSTSIEILGYEDNKILLKDHALNRIVEVAVRGGRLYCYLDRSDECTHSEFCSNIPLVRNVMRGV